MPILMFRCRRAGCALLCWCVLWSLGCTTENLDGTLAQSERSGTAENPVLKIGVSQLRQAESAYETVGFTGIVKPERFTNLSFARSGRIQTIELREGESVEADALLASLNQNALEMKKAGLEQSLQKANEELAKLNPSEPVPTVEETRQKLRQLGRQLNALDAELSNSGNSADLQERVRTLERQIELMNRSNQQQKIEKLQRRIARYESQLQEVEQELASGLMYAPYPGVIAQISVHRGALVSPQVTVMQIGSHTRIVQVNVPNSVASRLNESAALTMQAGPESFRGSVRSILPQIDSNTRTRTVLIDVSTESLRRELVPGETVSVNFQIDDPQSGFWLPLSALVRESEGVWTVYVVERREEHAVVAERTVKIARLEQDRALVQGDLSSGDLVVRDGVQRVVPGQAVIVVDETTAKPTEAAGETSE